ncbi:macro domain-containing protein [Desulfovibrio mangrovi]|uniref:macro domain-containing protein n=1 Tax=Desulfovibrio mangrovi TaxID=2976983 RepID=UPI002248550A|nr:macro domain-containing protein [Desulfovibrio mangrovi]UZP67676.1 macro domain-containing protein [Desulfovibrio mangrovi]
MLTYVSSSIWASPAQTIVNTVNTVGVMGKGIALQYKKQFPDMYKKYKEICDKKLLDVGKLWLYKSENRYVLNFPTKKHWRAPSKPDYIESGLIKFVDNYHQLGITSISFPQLGTGNGGLNWDKVVRPMMEKYLKPLPIPVYIHIVSGKQTTPEHLKPLNEAIPFDEILTDIDKLVGKILLSIYSNSSFTIESISNEKFEISSNKETFSIDLEYVKSIWNDLNTKKILTNALCDSPEKTRAEYIYSIFSKIPYITIFEISKEERFLHSHPTKTIAISQPTKIISQGKLPW